MTVQQMAADVVLGEVARRVRPVEVVLDIGCGIRPQTYFKPRVHLCCEPHDEYVERLQALGETGTRLIVQAEAEAFLATLPDRSIDSVFLLDVIEHFEKDEGRRVLGHCVRVARAQVVIFTPLGFMSQEYEDGDLDAWGLHGGDRQRHLSGWLPEDFGPGWEVIVCPDFHRTNGKGELFDPPRGALWAIHTDPAHAATRSPGLCVVSSIPPSSENDASRWLHDTLASLEGGSHAVVTAAHDDGHEIRAGRAGDVSFPIYSLGARIPSIVWLDTDYGEVVDFLEHETFSRLLAMNYVPPPFTVIQTAATCINERYSPIDPVRAAARQLRDASRHADVTSAWPDGAIADPLGVFLDASLAAVRAYDLLTANTPVACARLLEVHARATTVRSAAMRERATALVCIIDQDPYDWPAATLAAHWTGLPLVAVLFRDYQTTWPAPRRGFAERVERLLLERTTRLLSPIASVREIYASRRGSGEAGAADAASFSAAVSELLQVLP